MLLVHLTFGALLLTGGVNDDEQPAPRRDAVVHADEESTGDALQQTMRALVWPAAVFAAIDGVGLLTTLLFVPYVVGRLAWLFRDVILSTLLGVPQGPEFVPFALASILLSACLCWAPLYAICVVAPSGPIAGAAGVWLSGLWPRRRIPWVSAIGAASLSTFGCCTAGCLGSITLELLGLLTIRGTEQMLIFTGTYTPLMQIGIGASSILLSTGVVLTMLLGAVGGQAVALGAMAAVAAFLGRSAGEHEPALHGDLVVSPPQREEDEAEHAEDDDETRSKKRKRRAPDEAGGAESTDETRPREVPDADAEEEW